MKVVFTIPLIFQLLLVLPCSVYGLRLYTHDEYNAARERAVQTARNGKLKSAILSLERLLKLEPDNYGAFNDYITILIWDKQYQTALQESHFLNLKETPEYVLRALINAAEKKHDIQTLNRLIQAYINKYPVIPKDTPAIISGKSFHEIAELTERIGMTQTSLSILKVLHAKHPEDQGILADYINALYTNNQPAKALALLPLVTVDQAPEFEIDALIKSSQQLGKKELHKKLLAKPPKAASNKPSSPKKPSLKPSQEEIIIKARSYLKTHEFDKARKLLYPLYIKGERSDSLLNTVALYFTIQKDYIRAAFIYLQLYESNPGNRAAKRYMILNLFYAGAPFKAEEWLKTDPSLLNQAETNKILTDLKAFQLRWSGYTLAETEKQTDTVDKIIQQLQKAISVYEPKGYDYNLNRLQMDYIVALHQRGLTKKVLEQYALLYSESYTFPDYVLSNVAGAYLDIRQPDEARKLYLDLLTRDSHNFALHQGLFWAYFDNGDFNKGLELAATLNAATPLWRKDHSGNIIKANNEKLKTSMLAALAKGYSNDLAGAQEMLEEMTQIAPYNTEILYNLATLYRWRGWPQKSYETTAVASTFDPDLITLKIAKAYSLFEMHHITEAEKIWITLSTEHEGNKLVQQFSEEWHRWHKREFLLWSDGGNSGSDHSNYGSSDFSLESILYDSIYANGLRPFIHQYYTSANFDEGIGRYERIGAGTEYKKNRNVLSAELTGSYTGKSDIGLSLHSQHDIGDQLQVTLGYDSFSTNIPVRAYFHGINGQGYKAEAQYRLHELTNFAASYEFLDFSDGNRRNSWSFSAQQRLLNLPRLQISLIPSIYQSRNSKIGSPYFNPEQDNSYNLNLSTDWLTYYHYDKKFTQTLDLNWGRYEQEHYGTESTYALVYQHKWDMDKSLNFTYGFKWSSNYYDGDQESRIAAFLSLGWRF
jgi:biofilm PGA synthesis protein PgaA